MDVYTLPELGYDYGALAPAISPRQLELHHSKHHAAYVKGANTVLERLQGDVADVDVPGVHRLLAFHLSGHVLHSNFWTCLAPAADGQQRPEGELAAAVDDAFGSFDEAAARLTKAVTTVQGSGWAALVWDALGQRLQVLQIHDHQGEVVPGAQPIFVIDAWEHAFYLDHANDKAAWTASVWKVADWRAASQRFESARSATFVRR
jgi:superoxide dismutase, Fe-Mn family